jgi:predicted pyridoxine 5'-phosphate oxidase superfamily flavin-nucleotide-binding protein
MGKTYESITPELAEFIGRQRMFFVASAPLDARGHVNVSPKGLDCLRVLDERRVAYLDLTGSGNETSAHLEENGRITLMFCAFEGQPKILRLYGLGRAILPDREGWNELAPHFEVASAGARQIVVIDVERVQTSCGFGVPLYEFGGQRELLPQWAEKKGDAGLAEYRRTKNAVSIDGLPTTVGKALAR